MPVKNDTSTRFMDEIRIIPRWTYFFVALGYAVSAAAVVHAVLAGNPPFPLAAMVPLAILGGTVIGCYILLIGYINADAGRRGMSRLGWTVLAMLVPNGLGIVLYFVLRKPLTARCPQCENAVQPGFNFCPRCDYKLSPSCPQCQRMVAPTDVYCAYCGTPQSKAASAAASPKVPDPPM